MGRYLAIDIETTGQHYDKSDVIIAFGACLGEIGADGKWSTVAHFRGTNRIDTGLQGLSWEKIWGQRGFEKACLSEFWSERGLKALEFLHSEPLSDDNGVFDSEERLIRALNEMLSAVEKGGSFQLLFDTVLNDPVWLDYKLRRYGFAGLAKNRDGTGWRGAYETDSLRFGLAKVEPGNWRELNERLSDVEAQMALGDSVPHDPLYDAKLIFLQAAIAWSKEGPWSLIREVEKKFLDVSPERTSIPAEKNTQPIRSLHGIELATLKLLDEVDGTSKGRCLGGPMFSGVLYPSFLLFIDIGSESYEKLQRQLVEGFVEYHGTGREVTVKASFLPAKAGGSQVLWLSLTGKLRDREVDTHTSSAMALLPSGEWRDATHDEVDTLAYGPFPIESRASIATRAVLL